MGIISLFAATRLVLIMAGMIAWNFQIPVAPTWRKTDHKTGIHYALAIDQPFLDMWTRWDSWEYDEIARVGYWYDYQHKPSPYGTVACFPLYPMLIRGVGFLLGGRTVIAGLLIANLAAVAGFILLFQWGLWWGDRRSAWLTVAAAISFPAGLFWSALYPQALFMALSVGALAQMFDRRVAVACLLTALATATRLEAVALLPVLLLIRLSQSGWRPRRADLWFLVAPLGLLGYMAYLYQRWGDPVLFLKVHTLFGRGLTNPLWTLVLPLTMEGGVSHMVVIGTYFVLGLVILATCLRLPRPIVVYCWLLFLIPLASGIYVSIYRVHLVNFPIYLAIGGLGLSGRLRILGWGLVASFMALQCYMMYLWVTGYNMP